MRKNQFEKLGWFEKILHDFFIHAGREHLPWRKARITAYEVWVSEIMLQQTQVSRVIGYYDRYLGRFPTVQDLAKASWEDFLPYYAGLGYYARGKNMLKAAKAVVETFGGSFPKDVEKLETLPGVGPYTAAAIASFAYEKDTIAWDTNLRRVVGRFFFGSKKADIPFIEFEEVFRLPAKELNGALMDFGSAICVSRPKCGACPLREKCRYFREKGKNELTTYNSRLITLESKVKSQKSKVKPSAGEKNSTLSFKDARVLLTLHEGHRKYYSSKKRGYAPFIVPSSHNTRAGIKDWFRNRYGLELSVRPPHSKIVTDGKPTLLVNAQILLGPPDFLIFRKEDIGHEGQ
jgi:A/G-specific adenine glycosylase